MAMTKFEIGKTVLIILALNILLPTADVVTDLILIGELYSGSTECNKTSEGIIRDNHPNMATAMLIPFCLNYIICFITFFRLGTNKKKTFIFPLLNIYPQFEAAKVILAILRDPETGLKSRRLYDQNIGLHETLIEAVPTTLILTCILKFISEADSDGLREIIYADSDSLGETMKGLEKIIIGETDLKVGLFFLTFILSIFSASLGLTRCLKNGVVRPIAPGRPEDNGRLILAFMASGCCLVMILMNIYVYVSISTLLSFTLLFLPSLLLAIFSTLDLSSRNSLKIVISHPSLILLPVFTFFTFSKIQCCGDRRVKFSVRFTLINMAASVVGMIAIQFVNVVYLWGKVLDPIFYILDIPITLIISSPSILFTLSFLYIEKFCKFCCGCCYVLSAPGQLSVFDPDQPKKTFIINNGAIEEVIEVEPNTVDEGNIPTVENELNTEERISLKTIGDFVEIKTTVNDRVDDIIDEIIATIVNFNTEGRDTDNTSIVIL